VTGGDDVGLQAGVGGEDAEVADEVGPEALEQFYERRDRSR
jgi:hypothetical protein